MWKEVKGQTIDGLNWVLFGYLYRVFGSLKTRQIATAEQAQLPFNEEHIFF